MTASKGRALIIDLFLLRVAVWEYYTDSQYQCGLFLFYGGVIYYARSCISDYIPQVFSFHIYNIIIIIYNTITTTYIIIYHRFVRLAYILLIIYPCMGSKGCEFTPRLTGRLCWSSGAN